MCLQNNMLCVSSLPEGVSVGAVVLLDEDRCSTTLLELPLLMETPEMTLDQDCCQGHPLIKCILTDKKAACSMRKSILILNSVKVWTHTSIKEYNSKSLLHI